MSSSWLFSVLWCRQFPRVQSSVMRMEWQHLALQQSRFLWKAIPVAGRWLLRVACRHVACCGKNQRLDFFSQASAQVQVYGQLIPVQVPGLSSLTPDDTRQIAADLIGDNKQAVATLREHGSCDISYGLSGVARFRVNIFIQRGSCAVVMRVISTLIPDFASLNLPEHLADVAKLRDGIVLVTGPAGSGKSSTLAVLLDCINREKYYHIITIEDPIEFLHSHKCSTVHQRELHSDTPELRSRLALGSAAGAEGNSGGRNARP